MNRTIFLTGIIFGGLAVVLGAFGAHGLEHLVDARAMHAYETGVKYQMYHALLLLVLGTSSQLPVASKKWIFYCLAIGIVLFSFSLYLLATKGLTGFDFSPIGLITPVGGTFLIAGWALLGYRCLRQFN
ncbi:MAG: DUF423 domain-containing protein [Flavobacteriaceae bacterium]